MTALAPDTAPRRSAHRVCATLCLALLSACGGGGGDGPALQPPPEPGATHATLRPLDLAVGREGLFAMVDEASGEPVYSRYGRFDIDRNGALVHEEGWRLVGRGVDAAPSAAAVPLPPVALVLPARATSQVRLELNLNSHAEVVPSDFLGRQPFDATDGGTYTGATSVTVHDATGREIALTFYFRKLATDRWSVVAMANGMPTSAMADLQFTPDGRLVAGDGMRHVDVPSVPRFQSSDFTDPLPALALDFSGAVQFGTRFTVSALEQDGHASAPLASLDVGPTGEISAHYGNRQSRRAGQMLLAKFSVSDRLARRGVHGWACDEQCAGPLLDRPGTLAMGELRSGVLEGPPRGD